MDHLTHDCTVETIQVELLIPKNDSTLLKSLPRTKDAFPRFPETRGWRLDKEYILDLDLEFPFTQGKFEKYFTFGKLIQAWLYFGLILSVVQDDGKPILQYDGLCSGDYLSTKSLKSAIERWVRWEIRHPDGREFRLIQAEMVLEKARRVIRRNSSCTLERESIMERGISRKDVRGGKTRWKHAAEPDRYSIRMRHSRYLPDQIALALMVVGEFLSAAKSTIIDRCGANLMTGWHGDDDAGWGLPRYVIHGMIQDSWCPRAIFLLKGLLKSIATLLLHAYSTYKGSSRMVERHDNFDEDTCRAKSTDKTGKYVSLCVEGCDMRDIGGCPMFGPTMDGPGGILSGLASTNIPRGQSDIPLIRFESTQFGNRKCSDPISFAVETLNPQNRHHCHDITCLVRWMGQREDQQVADLPTPIHKTTTPAS